MQQYPKLKLLTSSIISLLTTTETKNYLKVDHTVDDSLIADIIQASTDYIENETGISLFTQTWEQLNDGDCEEIELFKEPVQSVNSVTYYENFDSTGTVLTENTDYRHIDKFLIHADNYFDKGRPVDGYTINYTVGRFTTTVSSTSVEASTYKLAALKMCGWLYENREEFLSEIQEGINVKYDYTKVPQTIVRMLRPYSAKVGL